MNLNVLPLLIWERFDSGKSLFPPNDLQKSFLHYVFPSVFQWISADVYWVFTKCQALGWYCRE